MAKFKSENIKKANFWVRVDLQNAMNSQTLKIKQSKQRR